MAEQTDQLTLALAGAKVDGKYILGPEVRVECECSWCGRIYPHANHFDEEFAQTEDCCDTRGWNPLDPEKLGRWWSALSKAGYIISVWPPGALVDDETDFHNEGWMSAYWSGPSTELPQFDTPEFALLMAAAKALGLEVASDV